MPCDKYADCLQVWICQSMPSKCPFLWMDTGSHLTYGSSGPPKSISQMASQLTEPFCAELTFVTNRQTNTDNLCKAAEATMIQYGGGVQTCVDSTITLNHTLNGGPKTCMIPPPRGSLFSGCTTRVTIITVLFSASYVRCSMLLPLNPQLTT